MGFPVITKEGGRIQQVGMLTQYFRFRINGTSDPDDIVDPNDNVLSIVRAGVGDFDVTLNPEFRPQSLVHYTVSVEGNADGNFGYVDVDSYDRDAGTFNLITTNDSAFETADDPANDVVVCVSITGQMLRTLV